MKIFDLCNTFLFLKFCLYGQFGIPKLTYKALVFKRLVCSDQSNEPLHWNKFSPNINGFKLVVHL